jgi:TolA-binding protein
MQRFRILTVGSACLVAVMSGGAFADDRKAADPADAVLDAFVKSLQADKSVDADARTKALAAVQKLRKDKENREFAITEALRELSPEFRKALGALGAEDFKTAIDGLKPLVESKNEFLAAESRYYLARAYIFQEKYEFALPHLDKLDTDLASKTIRGGESLFLKGASQLHLLKRKEAAATLAQFLKKYPKAPERLRVAAWRQLEVLRSIGQGTLPDIHQHMLFSRRKLALKDSGEQTQKVQQRIVAMLDKMIKEAEKPGGS